jgi:hypothetical protein
VKRLRDLDSYRSSSFEVKKGLLVFLNARQFGDALGQLALRSKIFTIQKLLKESAIPKLSHQELFMILGSIAQEEQKPIYDLLSPITFTQLSFLKNETVVGWAPKISLEVLANMLAHSHRRLGLDLLLFCSRSSSRSLDTWLELAKKDRYDVPKILRSLKKMPELKLEEAVSLLEFAFQKGASLEGLTDVHNELRSKIVNDREKSDLGDYLIIIRSRRKMTFESLLSQIKKFKAAAQFDQLKLSLIRLMQEILR